MGNLKGSIEVSDQNPLSSKARLNSFIVKYESCAFHSPSLFKSTCGKGPVITARESTCLLDADQLFQARTRIVDVRSIYRVELITFRAE